MVKNRNAYGQPIEDAIAMMDKYGFPHMVGRLVGALLVCIPPYRSEVELADELPELALGETTIGDAGPAAGAVVARKESR